MDSKENKIVCQSGHNHIRIKTSEIVLKKYFLLNQWTNEFKIEWLFIINYISYTGHQNSRTIVIWIIDRLLYIWYRLFSTNRTRFVFMEWIVRETIHIVHFDITDFHTSFQWPCLELHILFYKCNNKIPKISCSKIPSGTDIEQVCYRKRYSCLLLHI